MFRILKLYKAGSKVLPRKYSTASLQEINHNRNNLLQIKHFQTYEREKQEKQSSNSFAVLLLTCSLGIVLCETTTLTQDEKRLLKACQYGLALEVKR